MDQGASGEATYQLSPELLGGEADAVASARERFSLARWLPLARPATLVCVAAPVLAVWALLWARGARLSPLTAVSTLLAALVILAGANLLDGYIDHERYAALRRAPVLRGPLPPASAVEDAGLFPLDVLRGGVGLLAAGALFGIPAALAGGWATILLGLLGIAAAVLYSATPYALKRLPGGEVAVALALGPGLVAAAVLAQRQRPTGADVLLGFAFGCFTLALFEAAHLADAADREQRRRTLITLLGDRGGRALFAVILAAAYVLIVLVALQPRFSHGAIAALLSLPVAIVPLSGAFRAQSRAALHLLIGQTRRAYTAFSIWLIVGFIIAGAAVRLYPPIHTFLFG